MSRATAVVLLAVAGAGVAGTAARGDRFAVVAGLKRSAVGVGCQEVVVAAGALWATQRLPSERAGRWSLALARLDPKPLGRVESWVIADQLRGRDRRPTLVSQGDRIWIGLAGDSAEIVAFDARALRIERRVRLASSAPRRRIDLAVGAGQLWALADGDLFRIEVATGAIEPVALAAVANGLSIVRGSIWLRDVVGTEIARHDGATLARQPPLELPGGHWLTSGQFARTWLSGESDPAILLSSRPPNRWTGRPAPDVVAAFDAAGAALVPALRLGRAIADVEVAGSRAAVLVMDYSKARIGVSLLLVDWPRRAVDRELLLGAQLDPDHSSSDPGFLPGSIALGDETTWVCLADYGVVAVPLGTAR